MRPPLPMRCDTQRDAGGSDPYGGGEDFQPHLSSVACYWWTQSGREAISDERSVVVADEHLLVARDADVREGDRITSVTDQQRRTVLDRARTVEHVAVERTHLDCSLRAVGG